MPLRNGSKHGLHDCSHHCDCVLYHSWWEKDHLMIIRSVGSLHDPGSKRCGSIAGESLYYMLAIQSLLNSTDGDEALYGIIHPTIGGSTQNRRSTTHPLPV